MSIRSGNLDPVAALAGFGRVSYSELVTVVVVSVLTSLLSLSVVGFGPGVLAAAETMTAVVAGRGGAGPHHERERLSLYLESVRANARRGLLFSLLFGAVIVTTYVYWRVAVSLRSGWFLLGMVVGAYALLIVVLLTYRAGTIAARHPDDLGAVAAIREAILLALADPSFTGLQVVFAGLLVLLSTLLPIAVPLLLFGLLAVLEVVTFEELAGDGAAGVVRRYQRGDV